MKLFTSVEEMEAILNIRRPKSVRTTDQIVAQAARTGFTVGIAQNDLVGAQCGAVIGLYPQKRGLALGQADGGSMVFHAR
jgi:hypothetical protein